MVRINTILEFRMLRTWASAALILITLAVLAGCGGGTTGTSPTGKLSFQGRTDQAIGVPLARASLVVVSTDSGEPLQASETDQDGHFSFDLPAEESGVLLEVNGERTPPFVRHFTGSSVLTSVVVKQSEPNGNGTRRFFDVTYSFELKVDESTLCPALSAFGNSIEIRQSITSDSCPVDILGFSRELENESFYSQLIGVCDGNTMPLSLVRASSLGRMTVDLAEAYRRGCTDLRISAYSVRASDTRVVIPIRIQVE